MSERDGVQERECVSILKIIKSRKAAGLKEISPKEWKTRKFDDILFQSCNAMYN